MPLIEIQILIDATAKVFLSFMTNFEYVLFKLKMQYKLLVYPVNMYPRYRNTVLIK